MKRIVILGSSGSIGRNALRVVEQAGCDLEVVGLAANRDYERVLEQAARFGVQHVAVADPERAERCAECAPAGVTVHAGAAGVEALAALDDVDVVLCAVVGIAGLRPVMAAIDRGRDVALATKEVLVAAGAIVTAAAAASGSRLLPVDSEHSAIFQCLSAGGRALRPEAGGWVADGVKRLVLTASGGAFGARPDVDFSAVTVDEVLDHPSWTMGRKVTVDSASLMNKGLELIEARWLFNVPVEEIDVLVHPESIVHSLVEFVDGSVVAQLSEPDMRFAIQYALTYPDRVEGGLPPLDLARIGQLHFGVPDTERFPCLGLAREAARRGGTMPAVLNAANEVAVARFLAGDLPFCGIWDVVAEVMRRHDVVEHPDLDAIVATSGWAEEAAGSLRKT